MTDQPDDEMVPNPVADARRHRNCRAGRRCDPRGRRQCIACRGERDRRYAENREQTRPVIATRIT